MATAISTATATATAAARCVDAVMSPVAASPLVAKMRERFLSLDIPLSALPLINANGEPTAGGAFHQQQQQQQQAGAAAPEIVCWLLDTRALWPGDNIYAASGAAQALSLISLAEQNVVTTKMFIADAKMSLGSALLKRLFICQALGIPWKDVRMARKGNEKHGKPCAVDEIGRPIDGIDFNVSHQNGLVTLIGWNGRRRHRYSPGGHIQGVLSPGLRHGDVMVGADIVCVNERESAAATIDVEGLDGWVDIYDSVFSDEERWSMKYDVDYVTLLDGTTLGAHDIGRHDRCISRHRQLSVTTPAGRDLTFSSEHLIDAKLRRFYTYFCYKEAYIKLAGEALLAPWLKQLEFFNVRSPKPGTAPRCSTHGVWGEEVDDVEVRLHGRPVDDVKMKVQAFEEDFMLATAIQGHIDGLAIPAFQSIHLHKDILAFAQEYLHKSPVAEPLKDASAPPADLMSPWESRYWS